MSDKPNRLEQIRDFVKKPYDEMLSDMKKAGKLQHQMGELAWAKEVMFDIITFSSNQSLSIDDRVDKMKMMVELLKSLPRAKPDNWVWDAVYDGYIREMQFWSIWKSMRTFFSDYAVAEIEEFVVKKVKEKDNKGNERTVEKSGWSTRTVDPTTALETYLNQPKGQQGQTEPWAGKVNLLRTLRNAIPTASQDVAYSKEFIENVIKTFGEGETIPVILVTLNYAFNEFNVPPNAIVILNTMMQGQQSPTTLHVTATQSEENQNT